MMDALKHAGITVMEDAGTKLPGWTLRPDGEALEITLPENPYRLDASSARLLAASLLGYVPPVRRVDLNKLIRHIGKIGQYAGEPGVLE